MVTVPVHDILSNPTTRLLLAGVAGSLASLVIQYAGPYLRSYLRWVWAWGKATLWPFLGPHAGILIGLILAGIFLFSVVFERKVGMVALRGFLAFLTGVSWWGYRCIRRLNEQQLEVLRTIEKRQTVPSVETPSTMASDGGRSEKKYHAESDTDVEDDHSLGGALAGGIAGGLLGSTFGPEGAIIGALLGAAIGDEAEKSAEQRDREAVAGIRSDVERRTIVEDER